MEDVDRHVPDSCGDAGPEELPELVHAARCRRRSVFLHPVTLAPDLTRTSGHVRPRPRLPRRKASVAFRWPSRKRLAAGGPRRGRYRADDGHGTISAAGPTAPTTRPARRAAWSASSRGERVRGQQEFCTAGRPRRREPSVVSRVSPHTTEHGGAARPVALRGHRARRRGRGLLLSALARFTGAP